MSDDSEDKLSPEERLLKVIQGKGSPSSDGSPAAAPAETPAIARTESDSPAAKTPPRLRPKPLKPRAVAPIASAAPATAPVPTEPLAPEESVDEDPIVISAGPGDSPESDPEPITAAHDDEASESADSVGVAPVPIFGATPDVESAQVFSDQETSSTENVEDGLVVVPEKESRTLGIAIVNTCIAALLTFAVIVILAFEIISQFSNKDDRGAMAVDGALPPAQAIQRSGVLPDLQDLLAAFNTRGFLVQNFEEAAEAPKKPVVSKGNSLRQYVKEHIVILGLSWTGDRSVQEAILMDRSGPRMHIVKPGDEISLSGGTLRIERIAEDAVVGHDGVEEIVIGKKKA